MIVIRHIEGRRSERVAWLLEELGVPYELDFVQGDVLGSLLALEKHHEMRMTPIVEDGDVVMVESSAILEYILAKYGKGSSLRPAEGSREFPAYLEFLHFAEGTAMQKIIEDRLNQALTKALKKNENYKEPPKLPGVAGSRRGAERILHYAENTLGKRPYFAGQTFTAADIMMHFPLKRSDRGAGAVQHRADTDHRRRLLECVSEGEGLHDPHGGTAGVSARHENDDAEGPARDVSPIRPVPAGAGHGRRGRRPSSLRRRARRGCRRRGRGGPW